MNKPTPPYNEQVFIGIDFHKRYSVFCVLDASGTILERGRIEHAFPQLFVDLIRRYPKARVVFETTMNCPSLCSRLANQASPIFKAAKWRRELGLALRNP